MTNTIFFAFIDSQNLNLGVQSQGWKLDFKRFRIYLKDKYKIQKAFLFIGYLPGNEHLYTDLQSMGYILVFKPLLINKKDLTKIKGNVDGELILHTMIQYKNFDKAMIVTGDGDFHCLIEHLQQKGKLHSLFLPNAKRYSALLRKFRRYFIFSEPLKNKLQKKRGSNLRTKP